MYLYFAGSTKQETALAGGTKSTQEDISTIFVSFKQAHYSARFA